MGGRCIYLVNAEAHWEVAKQLNPDVQNDEVHEHMIKDSFGWKLQKQLLTLELIKPYSTKILTELSKEGEVEMASMV